MATPKLPVAELQAALNARTSHDTAEAAAQALGIARESLNDRVRKAKSMGLTPSKDSLKRTGVAQKIKRLEKELKEARAESADAIAVKAIIGDIASRTAAQKLPEWMYRRSQPSSPGVPTLFLSDFHWGEVVYPSQINGVNSYNLEIARTRLKKTIESAFRLLGILSNGTEGYPGIVIPLGGDMISGDIHEELAESNEAHSIPTVLDLWKHLGAAIKLAADRYGNVVLPCVSGNHGRNTKKIRAKDRNHTSFDWLLYQLLAREFENDKRITFYIPDSADASFRIYDTKYLLTHGDQFRGGDGLIGCLGPIIRGDHKKRSRNAQIDMSYDVMMIGHFHQYIHHSRVIVNGSLKGYDEYAYTNNFGYEKPQQAMWITHPKYGITFRAPVYVEHEYTRPTTKWVSIPK